MRIQSELVTLEKMVKDRYFFSVPIYQRLYVWQDDQIRTLLADLRTAFDEKKDTYYLGGCIVVEREADDGAVEYELIDGQQRFTTLWMMSMIWQRELVPFRLVSEDYRSRPRISFSIRPEANKFFRLLMTDEIPTGGGTPEILDAIARIDSFLKEEISNTETDAFTDFVYRQVQMVLTRVPEETDLNKLFEVINNRGVQLQHHEILKARLLSTMTDSSERERYAQLWDACAYMNSYVEKHLRDVAKVRIADLFDNDLRNSGGEKLAKAVEVLAALKKHQIALEQESARTLDEIMQMTRHQDDDSSADSEPEEETYESDDVRSIVTFPMLLQHTLRIWLHYQGKADLPKILDKELLALFDEHFNADALDREKATSFIELLWEIRYLFDKHVIKWVSMGETEVHLISKLYLSKNQSHGKTYLSLQRQQPTANESFALLQSMLYHSQQITTHYWLTPFLSFLHCNPDNNTDDLHFRFLKHLDNHLLSTGEAEERPLIQRSCNFLQDPWRRESVDCSVLSSSLGVGFPHYWFYKLEFVLWDCSTISMTEEQRKNHRVTARNSVEHISPKNPEEEDTNRVSLEVLDRFGNLALVSRSLNSEYSNKPFNEKRQRFLNRNRSRLDSLKMALIYQNETWNDELATAHEEQMITLMESYLGQDQQVGSR